MKSSTHTQCWNFRGFFSFNWMVLYLIQSLMDFLKFCFLFMYTCLFECICVCLWNQKCTLDALELELQPIVNHPKWVLETKLESSRRAALNCWAASIAPKSVRVVWVPKTCMVLCLYSTSRIVMWHKVIPRAWSMTGFNQQTLNRKIRLSNLL